MARVAPAAPWVKLGLSWPGRIVSMPPCSISPFSSSRMYWSSRLALRALFSKSCLKASSLSRVSERLGGSLQGWRLSFRVPLAWPAWVYSLPRVLPLFIATSERWRAIGLPSALTLFAPVRMVQSPLPSEVPETTPLPALPRLPAMTEPTVRRCLPRALTELT